MTAALLALILATAADIITTRIGIARGFTERNALYGGNPTWLRLIALHGAVLALAWWGQVPVAAWVGAGLFAGLGLHNGYLLRKPRQ